GFARVDHHRPLRQGFPEAVYAPGKTPEQCAAIVAELVAGPTTGPILPARADEQATAAGGPVLLTRADHEQAAAAGGPVLLTRADHEQAAAALALTPGGRYDPA